MEFHKCINYQYCGVADEIYLFGVSNWFMLQK